MQHLCLLNRPFNKLVPRRFPEAWKRFCTNLYSEWISVLNCPVDTWNTKNRQFILNWRGISPTRIRYRSRQIVDQDWVEVNSSVFCNSCADKWKSYQLLMNGHAITYLWSEYFSLNSSTLYIIKPRWGQRREWIKLAYWRDVIYMSEVLNEQFIIQEYRKTLFEWKVNHDIRCIFYWNIFIWSLLRWWNSHTTIENMRHTTLPNDIYFRVKQQSEKLMRKTDCSYAIYSIDIGIDMITQKPFIIECTSSPWVRSLLGVDPTWRKLSAYLKSLL